jgi:hypothetical protein
MKVFTNKLRVYVFILSFIQLNQSYSQCSNIVTHYNGNDTINGVAITVSSSGTVDTNTVYCPGITEPYFIGYNYTTNSSSSGSYTFDFSPPINLATLSFSGISIGPGYKEIVVLYVNGSHYEIPSAGVSNGCDQLAVLTPFGNIEACPGCAGSGWSETTIIGPISSLTVLDSAILGGGYGAIFSLSICNSNSCTSDYTVISDTTECAYYYFGNDTITSSGTYIETFIKNDGCDSIVSLELTINGEPEPETIINEIACNSYIFGIDTLIFSGTYNQTLTNLTGCDSIVTLNLTINSTSGTDTHIACDTFTWIDGNTYTTSNSTATHTLTNTAGCDSVVTLNLLITNSTSGTDTQIACDTFTWIDGNTYTNSNSTATYTLTNTAGCDSVVTLNLLINTVNNSITQEGTLLTVAESGATYQWLNCPGMTQINGATSQSFMATANGDYGIVVTNNGCSDTSACYTVSGVGIIENDFGNELFLYPNPSHGNFTIDLGNNYQNISITITNLDGKLIQSMTYNESQLLYLKLEAPSGFYLLIIESGYKKAVIRLVKK